MLVFVVSYCDTMDLSSKHLKTLESIIANPHPEKEIDKGALKSIRVFQVQAGVDLQNVHNVMLHYKGYTGKVELDEEAAIFHDEVIDIKDVITFQGKSVDELERAFRDSIDDYLEF